MKLKTKLSILLAVLLLFLTFNLSIYFLFTRRCISDYSAGMQAKSVELDRYLPFVADSEVVKIDSPITLSGDLPVLDGAAALYPIISGVVHAIYPEDSVHFDGENFTSDSALQYTNTIGAYRGVVDGRVDLAFCVSPSEEQLAYANENGVELVFLPIGHEAFVFLVHADNPVDSLTCDQVRGIYAGVYKNWKQLGGINRPISALTRNQGSGSQSAFLNFMGDVPYQQSIANFLGSSIGFSFRFYVEGIVGEGSVKMLALDGVYPSEKAIRNRTYPIVNDLYLVYRKDNTNENLKTVIDFVLSEDGQAIVEGSGYIGLTEKE